MVRIFNECRGCDTDGNYRCRGEHCSYRHVERFFCDACGVEDKLYYYDGKQLCIECVESELEVVEGSGNEW